MAYLSSYKDQNWLVPQSIKDMIPKGHICFFVEELVEGLDFSNFDDIYDGAGHPAYHPRILMKTLIMGMLSRIRSSRKLASATRESFIFMYLAEKVTPDFRTIARFRKDNAAFIKDTFKQTVKLASDYKIIDLSFIGIDGSKVKAYASKKQYFDKEGLDKLDKAVDKMLEEDIALDELEEQIFGDKEEGITGIDERDLRKIVRENFRNKNKEKLKEKIARAKEELEQNDLKKVSLSDPKSRVMQHAKRYSEPVYNTQFSVTKNQIIVANDVCQDGHDAHQFIPQMKNVKENIKLAKETKVGVDCGYSDGVNIKFAEENKIDLYVPSRAQAQEFDGKEQSLNHDKYEYDWKKDELIVGRERFRFRGEYVRKGGKRILSYYNEKLKKKKDVPFYFRERLRMRDKMELPESREVYRLRKSTVEPVIGNIKQNLGFREFLLRGLQGTKIEVNLVSIAHNLQKIWRLRAAQSC
ncbi:IS1182 family transposase [Candidatus Woesearchaeota archaeon]|nr:IS1182 family transposase [Candidatus Woesearchaeota archaeon]